MFGLSAVYGDVFGMNAGNAESDAEMRVGARARLLNPCLSSLG